MIDDAARDKLRGLTTSYLESISELTAKVEGDMQVVILIYSSNSFYSAGLGCKACSVQAADHYVETNRLLEHTECKVEVH